jgi:cytochrome b561
LLRNTDNSYGAVAIFFHWLIAALFIVQIALGWFMLDDSDPARQFWLFQWHKSFGFLVLALALLRLIWKLSGTRPRDLDSMAAWERLAARGAHILLYVLLLAVPLSGWAIASTSPLQIPSFAFNLLVIPHLPMAISEEAEQFWADIHAFLAYLAAAIATGHMLAALRHHLFLRDKVLMRMFRSGNGEHS